MYSLVLHFEIWYGLKKPYPVGRIIYEIFIRGKVVLWFRKILLIRTQTKTAEPFRSRSYMASLQVLLFLITQIRS